MITRVFRTIVKHGFEKEFEEFFNKQALPMLMSKEGLLSITFGKELDKNKNEFLMISKWKDIDSLIEFTGKDWHKPVVNDEIKHLITEVFVNHYETSEL